MPTFERFSLRETYFEARIIAFVEADVAYMFTIERL